MRSDRGLARWLPLLLVLATLLAYQPVWNAGFIWDDDAYVTENPTLRDVDGLRRIWFEVGAVPQYYPLVHTVFWVEYHLWGLSPLGYHLVNVLLHALAAILLARLLERLKIPGAWLAAFVFALHPVGVESAAWVTELKNVLSTVLYLAAAIAYLRFDEVLDDRAENRRDWGWYATSLALFVGALLSKTVTCTLPAALLLVRWWKTGRIRAANVWPLLPFFAVGAALALQTAAIERHSVGAEGVKWSLTFAERCLIAGRAVWFYAAKLVWPSNLTFIYPRWTIDTALWWQWLFPAAAVGVVSALWLGRTAIGRGPLTAVLFFIGTLGPALGFVNVYPMRYSFVADHFQYLASIGLIALVAAAIERGFDAMQARSRGTATRSAPSSSLRTMLYGVLVAALSVLTWRQATIYSDLETLWRATIAANPRSSMALNNLGNLLAARGQTAEAMGYLEQAVRSEPDNPEALDSLGSALLEQGRVDDAVVHFRKALDLAPHHSRTHYNLGTAFLRQGRWDESISAFEQALAIQPGNALAHNNLGNAYFNSGRMDEAVTHYRESLRLQPDLAEASNNLGSALFQKGEIDAAADQYAATLKIRPGFVEAQNNLRIAAWTLATSPAASVRNGAKAVELATIVDRLSAGANPAAKATLAAAYAEAGRYPEAIDTARQALQMVAADSPIAAQLREQLALYESGQPQRGD